MIILGSKVSLGCILDVSRSSENECIRILGRFKYIAIHVSKEVRFANLIAGANRMLCVPMPEQPDHR